MTGYFKNSWVFKKVTLLYKIYAKKPKDIEAEADNQRSRN